MDVYRRYFRITEGDIVDEAKKILASHQDARNKYSVLLSEIGADNRYYVRDEKLTGIIFDNEPDKNIFKKVKHGWYPKKNNKDAKELCQRLENIEPRSNNELLTMVGLIAGVRPSIFGVNMAYRPTVVVIPSDTPVVFITVPWYDEDPTKLKKYQEERKTGLRMNSNLDQLLWKPTEDMEEVREWEFKRAIDEWNQSLKKKN